MFISQKGNKKKSYLVLQDPSFFKKEYAYTVTNTEFKLTMRYSN